MTTTENDIIKNINQINQSLVSENIEQNRKLIDDCFYVEQKRWKTWDSYDIDGNCLVTSFTKEDCIDATRSYLKWKQDGFPETQCYEGIVGGKL